MLNKDFFDTNELCANTLQAVYNLGFSVIPLQGKRPHRLVKWKQYQSLRPDTNTLNHWMKQSFDSYGIICGRVSQGIIVIDFDCAELYAEFTNEFSSISHTYTVKTKRGYHLYFKLAFSIPSRQFEKCDIKGDGGYVVGAGSTVNGYKYTPVQQISIQSLVYKQYKVIVDWLQPVIKQLPFTQLYKSANLQKRYKELVLSSGRNNALYTVACEARRNNISQDQTIEKLATEYARTPTNSTHKAETITHRLTEAIRTIKSAYNSSGYVNSNDNDLPNSIREKLLQIQKSTITSRILDGIRLEKLNSQWATLNQLLKLAKQFHISKRSILRVLTSDLAKANGKRIFKQIPYQDYIESYVSQDDKREPNSKVGRPTRYIYKIPTNEYLCNILKTEESPSDNLRVEDLYSAGAYRRALHRELIMRLSPIIRVDWYANRLGVHRRTIFRYNTQLGVMVKPTIVKKVLTKEAIKDLPHNESQDSNGFTPGMWLETFTGKRYPALKSIANNLVTNIKARVILCKQLPSRYTLYKEGIGEGYSVQLPDHLKSRGKLLTHSNIQQILSPDWATQKFDLGGYLAVYNGYEWTFRPPLRVIAYQLMKRYEEGLVYFIKPLKT
jgi:hypothetical protein